MNKTTQIPAGDVDIDFADRNMALAGLDHVPAAIIRNNTIVKHNTGVYFHAVPSDPISGIASLHYEDAEQRGWYKIDLLNVHVYEMVKNEQHLLDLMNREFDWNLLTFPEFTSQLIHLGNHGPLVASVRPCSIADLAMTLALIRPGKRHLINTCQSLGFDAIRNEIWQQTDGGYSFHKSHATGYAVLVKVHANLLIEQLNSN
jgi:hypothetical protein